MRKILEFEEKDLKPTNSFKLNDTLNPDLWEDMNLKQEVREKLIEIANEFISMIHGEFSVSDIYFTGSLASYNWSEYSDVDIHVKIDFSEINDDTELVEEYLKLVAKKFNNGYDISIYKYDVEIYLEDVSEEREHVNGLYSILNDKWVKKASPFDREIDVKLVEEKAINLMEQIDELLDKDEKNEIEKEELIEEINKIWLKIKKSRKDGISSPDGDLSIGNLVFKYLRRNEYISKIIGVKKEVVEAKYSLD